MRDLYKILNISRDADLSAITRAYRLLAREAHPDKKGDATRMAYVNEAYAKLSDPEARALFDEEWAQYQARHGEPLSATVTEALTTDSERFSERFVRERARLVAQYQNTPLAGRHITGFTSAETWGGFQRGTANNPSFPANFLDITLADILLALRLYLTEATSEAQVSSLKQVLLRVPDSHLNKAIYYAVWKIFNNQFDVDVVATLTQFMRGADEHVTHRLMELFVSKGWRAKVVLAYSKVLYPHNMGDTQAQAYLKKLLKRFDGSECAQFFLAAHRQYFMHLDGTSEEKVHCRETLRLLSLYQLYEESTSINKATNTAMRDFAFSSLDWIPAFSGKISREELVNFYLKAAYLFLLASTDTQSRTEKMADEQLALRMLYSAYQFSREINPYMESYALGNIMPLLPLFRFEHEGLTESADALEGRLHYLVDIFPFHFNLRSNLEVMTREGGELSCLANYLQYLLRVLDKAHLTSTQGLTIEVRKILYFSYEAAFRGWLNSTEEQYQAAPLRLRLMKSLLQQQSWELSALDKHLMMPYALVLRNEQHWLKVSKSLPIPTDSRLGVYSDIKGIKFDRQTGELTFSLQEWRSGEPEYLRLLTLFEVYEALHKNSALPFFSLDPVDANMDFHPYNKMRFAPANSLHTALMHTMLFADYILKFLTTGAEVQGQYPFTLRSTDHLIANLPENLKQLVYDFQHTQHDQSVHRFWIEPEKVTVAHKVSQEKYKISDNAALDDFRMVIKTHKMERDLHGHLVDATDKSEGWHIYQLTRAEVERREKTQEVWSYPALVLCLQNKKIFWMQGDGEERIISELDSTLPIVKKLLNENYSNGELVLSETNRLLRYQATKALTQQTNLPHYFSPEYVFAQEMTQHYEELGRCFPVFLRLKALCQLGILVRLINNIYLSVKSEIEQRQTQLNSSMWEDELRKIKQDLDKRKPSKQGEKSRLLSQLQTMAKDWRSKLSYQSLLQEQVRKLSEMYQEIQRNRPDTSSLKVNEMCERVISENRSRIIAEHGYNAWDYNQYRLKDEIRKQCENAARDASRNYLPDVKKQLFEIFSSALSGQYDRDNLVNNFVKSGECGRLAELLTKHAIDENIFELYRQLPHSFSTSELKKIIVDRDDSLLDQGADRLAEEILRQYDKQAEEIYQKQKREVEEQKKELKEVIKLRQEVLAKLKSLGITGEVEQSLYEGSECVWVPASIHRPSAQRLVYGGVNLSADLNVVSGDTAQGSRILSQAWGGKNVATVNDAEVTQAGKEFPSSQQISALYTAQSREKIRSSSTDSDEGGSFQELKMDVATQLLELAELNRRQSFFRIFSSPVLVPQYIRGHVSIFSEDEQDARYFEALTKYMNDCAKGINSGFAFSFVKTSLWLIANDDVWFSRFICKEKGALDRLLTAVIHRADNHRGFSTIRIADYLMQLFEATGQQGKLLTLKQHYDQQALPFFNQGAKKSRKTRTLSGFRKMISAALDHYKQTSWSPSRASKNYSDRLHDLVNNTSTTYTELISTLNELMGKKGVHEKPNKLRKVLWGIWLTELGDVTNDSELLADFLNQHEEQLDYEIHPISRQTTHPESRKTIGDVMLQSIDPQNQSCLDLLAFYGVTRQEIILRELREHLEKQPGLQQRIMQIDAYLSQPEEERQANPLARRSQTCSAKTAYDKKPTTIERTKSLKQGRYQDHHIIPRQLKDHPLLKLAGFDIDSRANRVFLPEPTEGNQSRPGASSMSAEERAKLPHNERRAFHRGNHDGAVVDRIERAMDRIVDNGKLNNWSKEKYLNKLHLLISEYRQELKQGNVALNKHHREWAKRF